MSGQPLRLTNYYTRYILNMNLDWGVLTRVKLSGQIHQYSKLPIFRRRKTNLT